FWQDGLANKFLQSRFTLISGGSDFLNDCGFLVHPFHGEALDLDEPNSLRIDHADIKNSDLALGSRVDSNMAEAMLAHRSKKADLLVGERNKEILTLLKTRDQVLGSSRCHIHHGGMKL